MINLPHGYSLGCSFFATLTPAHGSYCLLAKQSVPLFLLAKSIAHLVRLYFTGAVLPYVAFAQILNMLLNMERLHEARILPAYSELVRTVKDTSNSWLASAHIALVCYTLIHEISNNFSFTTIFTYNNFYSTKIFTLQQFLLTIQQFLLHKNFYFTTIFTYNNFYFTTILTYNHFYLQQLLLHNNCYCTTIFALQYNIQQQRP